MSEEEWTTDSDTDESDETHSDQKALPWHSMDLVKREKVVSGKKQTSFGSSRTNEKKMSSNDEAVSMQSRTLEFDKLKINSDKKKSPPLEMEIQKTTIPYNAVSWDDKTGDIDMKDPPLEINILLLGESGVGKSTFINSFANYMKHENFEAVQESMLSVLIPARFNIFDKEFKKHVIEMGANDENEHLIDGAAATQDVKTYVFYITLENKSYLIRLIDTPGIGDPRGIDQDNKNCDYVLSYLGRLEKIHAICLLLKPTNTRLDVFLNYCITQILSRLEKSATDNIAFLFTNTRGQNYTPGDTYTSLELLVQKLKDTNNVCLPLSHKNVFCFDNEAFRFLASIKQGVEFKEGILEANIESWKYSYKEVYRLLSYIVELKPHDPQKTVSINHARKMVLQLARPLAEIVQLIGDNIYQMDQHTNQLLTANQTMDELKQKLYMPVIDIRAKELPQPVTVCTAPKCSTVYKVADKNKYHYKQRCHNPCYLNNVPAEIIGDPHLLGCWAMTKSTQTCHQCGCRFNTHMHIYYETDTFETKIVDENVQKNIHNKEDVAREKQVVINKILNHKEQLEKEHKHIIKCSAAFAHFLQRNAITPMNDSLKEYVKYLITREENLGPESDKVTLIYLKRLLSEYEQEKNVLEEALKHNTSGIVNTSPTMIENKIKELFTLPNFGVKIKQLYDLHQSGGVREHKQSEYVVKERYNISIVDKVKSYGNAVLGVFGMGKSKKLHRLEMEAQRTLALERSFHERQYYERQRQEGHSDMQSTLYFKGHQGNPYYFGQHGPKNHYNNFEPNSHYFGQQGPRNRYNNFEPYYGCEEEEFDSPKEREHMRCQYALEYEKRDGDRKGAFDSRRQFFETMSGGFEGHEGGYDHQVALNFKKKHQTYDNNQPNGFPEKQGRANDASKSGGSGYAQSVKNKSKGSKSTQSNVKEEDKLFREDGTETQVARIGKIKNAPLTTFGGKKANKKKDKKNKKK